MKNLEALYNVSKNLVVLYVEDDEQVRKKTHSFFSKIFQQVDIAQNGKMGLERYQKFFRSHKKHYDIVITDIRMPTYDGLKLSQEIIFLNKGQNIIVTSAYDDTSYLIDFINIGIKKFIKKPFSQVDMIDSLYKVCHSIHKNNSNAVKIGNEFIWNVNTQVLREGSKTVKLSFYEMITLNLLVTNTNNIFSQVDIYNNLKYDDFSSEISVDSVKSVIKRLRKKLPSKSILNIYGQGYQINNNVINKY